MMNEDNQSLSSIGIRSNMKDDSPELSYTAHELKKRFINALREENAQLALRAYKCSGAGLMKWKKEEQVEKLRLEDERKREIERKQMEKRWKKNNGKMNFQKFEKSFQSKSSHTTRHSNNRKKNSCPCAFPILRLGGKKSSFFDSPASSSVSSDDIAEKIFEEEKEQIHPSGKLTAQSFGVLETVLHPSATLILHELKYTQDGLENKIKAEKNTKKQSFGKPYNFFNRNLRSNTNGNFYDEAALDTFHYDRGKAIETENLSNVDYGAALTTPLHEAARLGHLELVKTLLSRGGDPNERDGQRRKALHAVCGGFTRLEESVYFADNQTKMNMEDRTEQNEKDIGIKLYVPPSQEEFKPDKKGLVLFFQNILINKNKNDDASLNTSRSTQYKFNEKASLKLHKNFAEERLAALMALLNCSTSAPTLNSVDGRGRTALHYAAELGRKDICTSLLRQENIILTIVDEFGRTPCELASINGHKWLAAQLERRALMGGGEDAMILAGWSMLNEEDLINNAERGIDEIGGTLVPPFSWFETLENVEGVRTYMIEETKTKLDTLIAGMMAKEQDDDNQGLRSIQEISSNESIEKNLQCTEDVSLVQQSSQPQMSALMDNSNETSETCIKNENSLCQFSDLTVNQTSQLLAYFKWDSDLLLEEFEKKPFEIISKAEIVPTLKKSPLDRSIDDENVCLICFEVFPSSSDSWIHLTHCEHAFCHGCLSKYVSSCANSRDIGILSVPCPHHNCSVPLDISAVEKITGSLYNEAYNILLQIENENFVSIARDYSFCPSPECQGIVRCLLPIDVKKKYGPECINYHGAVCTLCPRANDTIVRTYEGVLDSAYNSLTEMPKPAHRFCFTCKKEPHWPISCKMQEQWREKIVEEVQDLETDKYEDVAHLLWMKANTRPCPKCQVRIEKYDGCNHMTCLNKSCKHEFCWICGKDWKLHGTKTGGYFRCNRWQEDEDIGDGNDNLSERPQNNEDTPNLGDEYRYGTALHEARMARKRNRAMGRFLHHYGRWSAHRQSAVLEKKMQASVCERMTIVVNSTNMLEGSGNLSTLGNGLSFIHGAFTELLECRSMLEHSYPFAFYYCAKIREIENANFELLQSELEMLTEQLSDIVARKHLRATMTQIMFMTSAAAEKRRALSAFIMAMGHGHKKKQKERRRKRPDRHVIAMTPSTFQDNDYDSDHDELNLDLMGYWTRGRGARRSQLNSNIDTHGRWATSTAQMEPDTNNASTHNDSDSLQEWQADHHEDAAFQLAVQASIRSHLAYTEEMTNLDSSDEEEDNHQWSCPECTYVNIGGRRCSVCGSQSNVIFD